MRRFIFFLFLVGGFFCFSQNEEQVEKKHKKIKASWSGQISIAKDVKTNVFLTLGGPNILLKFNNSTVNFGMFPSLRYNYSYDKTIDKTPFSTTLGTGFQYSYKKLIVGCLFYSVSNNWRIAPSIGFKL